MNRLWRMRVGDAVLYASRLYIGRDRLLFARLIGGDQEARALRKAIREGLRAAIYAPWSTLPDYVSLDPGLQTRIEHLWIQGLPRLRITLYLPVIQSGGKTWRFFLPGSEDLASEFGKFVERLTPYPVPDLSRLPPLERGEKFWWRLIRDGVSTIPAHEDPDNAPRGLLIEDGALREILADLARM